ncbi:hypothetical protein LMG33818_000374 [Halomonadaceae bacterium LMG 33818]|uniref:MFS transporter n=1 Tax=Cernens ardua TaxID=3402176 RepID=UPI003EDC4BDF
MDSRFIQSGKGIGSSKPFGPLHRPLTMQQQDTHTATEDEHLRITSTPDVSVWFIIRYSMAVVGLFLGLLTPVTITLALRVAELNPTDKSSTLGWIMGGGALAAMLSNPIFGVLSDRTRTRLGRRRPWLIGGLLVSVGSLAVIGTTQSLMVIGIAWWVTQASTNAALASLVAILPDRVPEHQRGKLSAFYGMSSNVAVFAGAAIINLVGTQTLLMFLVPGVIGFVCVAFFTLFYPEPEVAELPAPAPFRPIELIQSFWLNPRQHPDFAWAWLSRFMIQYGWATLVTYQAYYLIDVMGLLHHQVSFGIFISTSVMGGCIIVASLVSGWLSDRSGKRKAYVITAGVIYAIGLAILIFAHSFGMFIVSIFVSSTGLGIYLAVDQALVVDILPDRGKNAARNMGVMNIANALPQSVAPALAPLFLAIAGGGNYTALFCAAAIIALGGALAILKVKGVR